MKLYKKISLCFAAATLITVGGCKKILEEHPQSAVYPSVLNTQAGLAGGITGVYSDLRTFFTGENGIVAEIAGTDESIQAQLSTATEMNSYNGLTPTIGQGFTDFPAMYTDINTLNAVIQFAQTVSFDSPANKNIYLGHAYFLRAYMYFYLVTTFGDVPLHTTYITIATTADSRQPAASIYTQIIADLTQASTLLPNTPPTSGSLFLGKSATAAAAQLLLAKVYLTRGYSTSAVSTDFQTAATTAQTLITNKATYGLDLWTNYSDAMAMANDYGKETVFAFDNGQDIKYANYGVGSSGGRGNNLSSVVYRMNYPAVIGANNGPGTESGAIGTALMTRDLINGRPYSRQAPNPAYTYAAFGDLSPTANDSRYQASFQTIWIANNALAGTTCFCTPATGASRGTLVVGKDTAIYLTPFEPTLPQRQAFKGVMVAPSQLNLNVYPSVKKFDDNTRPSVNDFTSRPMIMMRFAEAYMIAAEANYKLGNAGTAAGFLNTIRQRAANKSTNTAAQNLAAQSAMQLSGAQLAQLAVPATTAGTTANTGADLILDEYTREFYGEFRRWHDLVRMGQLIRRVNMYNATAAKYISSTFVLRPIPQVEIDAIITGPKFPQNPGY